ncbi:MAG: hypothetical protein RLZZ15_1826 [Verrucomicrobiota bacterium]
MLPALRLNLRAFAGLAADTTLLWPRWLFLRAVGVVFIFVFAGLLREAPALVGPGGLAPLGDFFAQLARTVPNPLVAFFHAPGLFWPGHGAAAITVVVLLGLLAAVALTLNFWPRLALVACWLALLSFVTSWQIFSATQVDQLALETALLAIPFAPAGFRPGLGAPSPPRPLAILALRWLLFRVMFESGLIKLLAGDPRWGNLTALDVLYETAPFPTILGYLDHQLPHAWHVGEIALTFAAELVAPFLAVLGGRRARWIAFAVWTVFQAGIQLTNNFGWLNTAALALGLLLLDDPMLAAAARTLRRLGLGSAALRPPPPISPPLPPPPRPTFSAWRHHVLRLLFPAAVVAHSALTLYFLARVCADATGADPARPLPAVARFANAFHSANAYTLYGALLPHRLTIEFEGSNDAGTTWRAYAFRYQPQREDQLSPFLAPYYPRFEATLQALAHDPEPSPLYRVVAAHLLVRTPAVLALFRADPFAGDRPPQLIRTRAARFTFTDLATRRATGRYWKKFPATDHVPLAYLDERGAVAEAASPLDALRARALHGHRDSQHDLGVAFAYGEGVAKNSTEAARWFRLAADQGHAGAQFYLGLSHAKGDGVPQDFSAAAQLYLLAARQGHVPAQVNLGFLHARAEGVPRNDAEALAWFTLAARSERPEAVRVRDAFAARADAATLLAAHRRTETLATEITPASPLR